MGSNHQAEKDIAKTGRVWAWEVMIRYCFLWNNITGIE
jgi:hypothetical protein